MFSTERLGGSCTYLVIGIRSLHSSILIFLQNLKNVGTFGNTTKGFENLALGKFLFCMDLQEFAIPM